MRKRPHRRRVGPLLCLLAAAAAAAGGCSSTPPPPNNATRSQWVNLRTYIALNNGTQIPINDNNYATEIAEADNLWARWCAIGVRETARQTFTTPINPPGGAAGDVWEIYDIPTSSNPGGNAPEIQTLLNTFPLQPPNVNVYVVRALYSKDASGRQIELGGATPRPGYWQLLSGKMMGQWPRILAHELGHNFGLLDEGDAANVMHQSTPPGDQIRPDQCSVAVNSNVSQ